MAEKLPTGKIKALALAIVFVALSILSRLVPWFSLSFIEERPREVVVTAMTLTIVIVMTRLAQRRWPDAGFSWLQIVPPINRASVVLSGLGVLIGFGMLATSFVIVWSQGGIETTYHGPSGAGLVALLAFALAVTIGGATWEELTFRGWPLSVMGHSLGAHVVVWVIGTCFGLVHMVNSGWTWLAVFSVVLAGVFLGYAMLLSRNIAFPIGLHVGWNLGQTILMSRTLWEVSRHDDVLLSGGVWGLEASLAGVLITGAAASTMLILFVRARSVDQNKTQTK